MLLSCLRIEMKYMKTLATKTRRKQKTKISFVEDMKKRKLSLSLSLFLSYLEFVSFIFFTLSCIPFLCSVYK